MADEPDRYVGGPLRKNPMSAAEFAVFFNDVCSIATDPERAEFSPLDVLKKHGLAVDLPPQAARNLMPILRDNKERALTRMRAGGRTLGWAECGACGACGVCVACGGLDAGVPGAAAAAVWAIATVQPE